MSSHLECCPFTYKIKYQKDLSLSSLNLMIFFLNTVISLF